MEIEWTKNYACHRAQVGRIGEMSVDWNLTGGGYRVVAFGVALKNLSPDVEDGKRRALGHAERLLAKALQDVRSIQEAPNNPAAEAAPGAA